MIRSVSHNTKKEKEMVKADPRLKMQRLATAYGRVLDALANSVAGIEARQRDAVRKRFARLRKLHKRAAKCRRKLLSAVSEAPEIFVSPRTHDIAGVAYGWRRRAVKVVPGADTIALIKEHLPGKAATLIRQREELVLPALKDLSSEELLLVKCVRHDAVDSALVKADRSHVESQVAQMLSQAR